MPPADGLGQVHACLIRIGFLAPDGSPLPGVGNAYVSNALTKLTVTPNYRQGTEINEANGCDEVCVAYLPPASLKWGDVSIEVCRPDPVLEHFLAGGAVIPGTGDDPAGYAAPAIGVANPNPISIEVWSKRILHGDLDPDFPYAWWTYPKIRDLRPGARTHDATSKKPTFDGRALENPNYGDGPEGDWPSTSDRYEQWIPCTADELPAITGAVEAIPAS